LAAVTGAEGIAARPAVTAEATCDRGIDRVPTDTALAAGTTVSRLTVRGTAATGTLAPGVTTGTTRATVRGARVTVDTVTTDPGGAGVAADATGSCGAGTSSLATLTAVTAVAAAAAVGATLACHNPGGTVAAGTAVAALATVATGSVDRSAAVATEPSGTAVGPVFSRIVGAPPSTTVAAVAARTADALCATGTAGATGTADATGHAGFGRI
jgi:hypothetical protein